MSSQLQVSGEAKIRDIQGPVVANSGVITALDGAANQYVRGDGTLADFPSSTGGGSSVSYYLNSSVSQGTIGGVAYRELSKEPIIGTGTDITIAANGYVANYITDVNDPDVLSIPGGNFNCEFYFSVNNNTGAPYTYAQLYKYDGTTFTLLGSSVGVPEYINQGTIIAPYYFAIPVPTSALAITDRLAIRIYVNVDGRTVTLHTENSHLCQVVTTLSKGMVSLNNLTDQSQYLTTGTSGTDFAIVSSGDTHTFNLPIASASNTGKLSSTDWSTFNGKVPYTGAIADVDLGSNNFTAFGGTFNSILTINATGNQARALYMVTGTAGSQYGSGTGVNLFSEATDNLSILFTTASTTRKAILNGANLTTAKTYTLPDASGTIALTSNINYPVTSVFGRTGAVVAASGDYTTTQVTEGTNLYFTDARARAALSAGTGISYNNTTGVITNSAPDQTVSLTAGAGISISGTYPSFTIASTITQYTDALARAALSFTAGSGAYNSTTGVITIPTDNNQIANGAGYITSSALSGYLPLSGGTLTGGLNGTTATFSGLGTFYQLTMTGATAGRLFYAQTGGVFSQSGNLVWNNSTEQLGVGTPNPSAVVTAFSTNAATQLKAAGTAPAITFSNTLTSASLACVFGLATANNHFITGTAAGDMAIANQSTSAGAIVFGTGTFEKMRMSSTGNFGIGTSSPATRLQVQDAGNTFSAHFSGQNQTNGVAIGTNSGNVAVIQGFTRTFSAYNNISINPDGGNVGIGTSAPGNYYSTKLVVAVGGEDGITIAGSGNNFLMFADGQTGLDRYRGFIHYSHDSNFLAFGSDATERMRITSGGDVLIGTTTSGSYKLVVSGASGGGVLSTATGAGDAGFFSSSDSIGYHFYCDRGSSARFYVIGTGQIYSTSTSITAISDIRHKENIRPLETGLAQILQLKPSRFDWKEGKGTGKKDVAGFIAQDIEQVLPDLVDEWKETMDATESFKSIRMGDLIPTLVKAIQEQQAQIEELKELIKNK